MQLGYVGRLTILFPIALGSALTGATVVHRYFAPDLVSALPRCGQRSKAALPVAKKAERLALCVAPVRPADTESPLSVQPLPRVADDQAADPGEGGVSEDQAGRVSGDSWADRAGHKQALTRGRAPMLPRKPTRLELKQDDMTEYEEMKRERERARRAQAAAGGQAGGAAPAAGERVRTTAERIGMVKK